MTFLLSICQGLSSSLDTGFVEAIGKLYVSKANALVKRSPRKGWEFGYA